MHQLRSKPKKPRKSMRSKLSGKQVTNISDVTIILTCPPSMSQPLQELHSHISSNNLEGWAPPFDQSTQFNVLLEFLLQNLVLTNVGK